MKKKSIIILASVVVICAVGLLCSQLFNWPVNTDNASGNIAKSSRFSRKTADAGMSNMQELLQNDKTYKDNMVAAYYVMQSRAEEFNTLVDLSNQVADPIYEFDEVLQEMNEAKPMIENVCASMAEAIKNLDTALSGDPCEELAESVTNSALAYTTLQKQNKLADKFIDVADKYLAKNDGSNELKFVRDQWVAYQQMTAALDNDKEAAAELEKKGYTLTSKETMSTLSSFNDNAQYVIIMYGEMQRMINIDSPMSDVVTSDGIGYLVNDAVKDGVSNVTHESVSNATHESVSNITKESVGFDMMRFDAFRSAVNEVVENGVPAVGYDAMRNNVHETISMIELNGEIPSMNYSDDNR